MAIKVYELLKEELKVTVSSTTFWCDSMIVINSIRNEVKRFKTFVANRLNVIHSSSTPDQWRHIASEKNIADNLSRGAKASHLMANMEWRKGPNFLSLPKEQWESTNEVSEGTSDTL